MNEPRKALIINSPNGDLGDVVQIAKAVGKTFFRGRSCKVDEMFRTTHPNEWVVVVQVSDGVSESGKKQ